MPWTPVSNQENSLKYDIRIKAFNPLLFAKDSKEEDRVKRINYVYSLLLNANNYKQAVAVLTNIAAVEDIKKITEYGFNLITDNSPQTIKATMGLIPAVLAQRKQAKIAQDNLNAHINGYLASISAKYKQHRSGAFNEALPYKKDSSNNWAVFYNNDLNKLPAGNNIEWYPFTGSTKSPQKRFFTHRNIAQIWYAEGGTHGNAEDWWTRMADADDWKKI